MECILKNYGRWVSGRLKRMKQIPEFSGGSSYCGENGGLKSNMMKKDAFTTT